MTNHTSKREEGWQKPILEAGEPNAETRALAERFVSTDGSVVVLDTAARTLAAPIEIPVGLLTAICGAPVLVWVMLRRTA